MFKLIKRENGFTLVEVLVALSIMAMVAVIFLLALVMAGKAVLLAQEKTIAESIARSQIEYVKQQGYDYNEDDPEFYHIYKTAGVVQADLIEKHPSFSVWSVIGWDNEGNPIEEEGVHGVYWNGVDNSPVNAVSDSGIQKIGLVIKHGENVVFYLEGYVVDR